MNLLTAREREIASLVASGKNNRAIASDLCVSLRTVENHLYSIYSKLAVNNRTELALTLYRSERLRHAV
jgi:DNA-binding NarL/FixJ family response regulator